MSSFEVQLAVYDLSHGMARQLSAQFLEPAYAIDIIPHSALIVYGREYFFGGGIQQEDPQAFRQSMGLHPIQTISLGNTSVTQAQFNEWCRNCTLQGRYTMASYDLLTRNCNNFCHDAALEGLQLQQGIPQWILDVPQKFMSSPMGQMVRPMLENMQVTGPRGATADPFAANANAPAVPPQQHAVNPWARLKSPTDDTKQDKEEDKRTPFVDSFCKPLLSSDSKTISVCIKKIAVHITDASDQQTLESYGKILSQSSKMLSSEQVQQTCRILLSLLQDSATTATTTVTTFSLMLLRVVILQSTGNEESTQKCLDWISEQLSSSITSSRLGGNHAARSMAWLCASNAVSLTWWRLSSAALVEVALRDLNLTEPIEVKQAAAAFCYNFVISQAKGENKKTSTKEVEELSDDKVSLLCASLESLEEEPDATIRLRRLMVAAVILKPPPPSSRADEAARSLIIELGFAEALIALCRTEAAGNQEDAKNCQILAGEIVQLLSA